VRAITADVRAQAARFAVRPAGSIHFGGGTPSLLKARELELLIAAVRESVGLSADAEVTLECNPEDAARFADHAAAGVTRFSLGVQALDDAALSALGRAHDAHEACAAVEVAARTGARVSVDLMYAREGQSVAAWCAELARALTLPIEHLSAYQLTIEPGTAFASAAARGTLKPPDAELAAALYEATQEACEAAGFPAYEISNHARGQAAQSRHNLLYWRSQDWIGVGPGAHGRLTDHSGARVATRTARHPRDYVARVEAAGDGLDDATAISAREGMHEKLLMGLRLAEGVALDVNADRAALFEAEGLLWRTESDAIALTPRGRLLADRIARELAP
jgi:oxygen-independent coproporphyrinogen-3 oxidase